MVLEFLRLFVEQLKKRAFPFPNDAEMMDSRKVKNFIQGNRNEKRSFALKDGFRKKGGSTAG